MGFEYSPEALSSLFQSAKEKDEFEFVCTLLRVRGMESVGWDTLEESRILIMQLLSIIEAPIENTFRKRMLLLLYCHILEMNDLYNIIANLLRIAAGERYSMTPFYHKLYKDNEPCKNLEDKIKRIIEICKTTGNTYIGDLFSFILCKQVRNAFFHSDYTIYENEFRIINGPGICINGKTTSMISFENWLIPKIEVTINFVLQLLNLLGKYRMSYKEEKIIESRMGGAKEVTIEVGEHGLMGFHC